MEFISRRLALQERLKEAPSGEGKLFRTETWTYIKTGKASEKA